MQTLEKKLLKALQDAIDATGITRVAPAGIDASKLDCVVELLGQTGPKWLAIAIEREAYPRDIRNAMWKLENFRKDNPQLRELIMMVVAEHISEGAKEHLRRHGIAYFDASGTFYLKHRAWHIDIQRPAKPPARKGKTQLFTGAREQVVHALLHARNEYISGLELAKLSQTSTYTVSTVLSELERLEWITNKGSGRTLRRKLSQPGELLNAWSAAWTQRKETQSRWYFYAPTPAKTLVQLAQLLSHSSSTPGIFTGSAAANAVEPHLTRTDNVDLIISPGQIDDYVDLLHIKPAEKGANLTLIERAGSSLLFAEPGPVNGAIFASPFILYLDLLNGKGRNKELAEQLRRNQLNI